MSSIVQRLFTEHPASVDERWGEHCARATGFGLRMILGGLACLVHALIPGLFVRTGSETIERLHRRMVTHRTRPELWEVEEGERAQPL